MDFCFCLLKNAKILGMFIFEVILVLLKKKLGSKCSKFNFRGSKQNRYFIYYILYNVFCQVNGFIWTPELWLALPMVISGVTLSNITPSNDLLLNLYFKNFTVGLHVLYVLNIHANFHNNWMLFIIQFINSSFIHYFKLQKFEFKQLIVEITINFWSPWNFASMKNIWKIM